MIRGQGWPCLDTWVPWLCSGTSLMGHRHLPIMTCRGELALPPAPRLLIRGGQEIAWVLGDKSIRCLAGGRRARALPDRSLPISPSTGGLLQARPGSSGGDKCGTAACARSHQAWLCSAGGLEKPRCLGAAAGKKWGGLAPHILQWVVPKFVPKSPPSRWAGGWGWLCSPSREVGAPGWAPRGPRGLFTNRRELAQGSWAPAGPGGL